MERLVLDARERGRDATSSPRAARSAASTSTRRRSGPSAAACTPSPSRAASAASTPSRASGASPSCATPTTSHLLVSMASLVGKWVRDLLMARVVRYHRAIDPDLPDASGYHDPVTTRFIDATRLTRSATQAPRRLLHAEGVEPGARRGLVDGSPLSRFARACGLELPMQDRRLTSPSRASPRAARASRRG